MSYKVVITPKQDSDNIKPPDIALERVGQQVIITTFKSDRFEDRKIAIAWADLAAFYRASLP